MARHYVATLVDAGGVPQVGQQVQVLIAGTASLASLTDVNGASLANPVSTDSNGQYGFFVGSGVYDFKDGLGNSLQTGVQIFDLTNPGEWLTQLNFVGLVSFSAAGFSLGTTVVDERSAGVVEVGGVRVFPTISETPTPVPDGTTTVFTLAAAPNGTQLLVFRNGVLQKLVVSSPTAGQYTLATNVITLGTAPLTGDDISVTYWS